METVMVAVLVASSAMMIFACEATASRDTEIVQHLDVVYATDHADTLGIDASRAVTTGSSAGGQLALAMKARAAEWVRQGIVSQAPDIVGAVAHNPACVLREGSLADREWRSSAGVHLGWGRVAWLLLPLFRTQTPVYKLQYPVVLDACLLDSPFE